MLEVEGLPDEKQFRFINFKLNDEWYGQGIQNIKEVNRVGIITEMPGSPPYILGVINLRGRVIPVMDLRLRLGLPSKEISKESRVIVVELNESIIGMLVDSVHQVLEIPVTSISEPPDAAATGRNRFIHGIGQMEDRLVFFIDVERIIEEEDRASITVHDEAEVHS